MGQRGGRLPGMTNVDAAPAILRPFTLGRATLSNRMVVAPLTRSRADAGDVPGELAREYYRQRAGFGLILTEGSQVSPLGKGYPRTSGIYSPEQVQGWQRVTADVHARGGHIFLQLWHVGRLSHPDYLNGETPVAPSAVPGGPLDKSYDGGFHNFVVPRALETGEVRATVQDFRQAAQNARDAGFDGVEIHGANGYLLEQFLLSGSNQRSDEYGGSLDNRLRFPLEVTRAVLEVWDAAQVGYRISPTGSAQGIGDENIVATYTALLEELNALELAYLHVAEFVPPRGEALPDGTMLPLVREHFGGAVMANGGFKDERSASWIVEAGHADLVSFGEPSIANPDLPERFRTGAALNQPDRQTFYQGEEKGYTDYPAL